MEEYDYYEFSAGNGADTINSAAEKTAGIPIDFPLINPKEKLYSRKIYRLLKRIQDIFLSLLAMLILSPVFLMISILIVLDDPKGGPIFSQIRVGKDGKEFKFYKFRSMCVDAEEKLESLLKDNEMDGPAFKIKNDPRITRVGRFIRKTSIDELPQLWNIFKGEMSIVGPRPPLPREVKQYDDYAKQRLSVTPGLTCYWQIQPNRNRLSFQDWMRLDIKYIKEQSFLVDWKIILRTLKVVLLGDGI